MRGICGSRLRVRLRCAPPPHLDLLLDRLPLLRRLLRERHARVRQERSRPGGSLRGRNEFTGSFRAAFIGGCTDCVGQPWPVFTATC